MILGWLRNRRRRKLRAGPFPADWQRWLDNLPHYRVLNADEQSRLRDDVRVFVAEKNWEGCGGLTMTDEIKVTVAAYACLLTLNLQHDFFARVLSVLVYPAGYAVPDEWYVGGTVWGGESFRSGEAWYRGPVILSWSDIERDIRAAGKGSNLVLHEFAHQLDMLDSVSDGTPPLDERAMYRQWHEVMTAEYQRLAQDARQQRPTLLDPYGLTNEAEFFAVATECFFDQPVALRDQHAHLYDLLRQYYRQDPAGRVS